MSSLRYRSLYTGLVLLTIGALLLVGCSGNFAPTLPSPDGEAPPPPDTVDIYGQVTDSDGQPLAGVRVDTTDGTHTWTDTTDEQGNYRLEEVTTGSRGVSFALDGYATEHSLAVVEDQDVEVNAVMASPTEGSPTECPVITLNDPVVDLETGIATISGSASPVDSDNVVLLQNGQATLIGLDVSGDTGTFSNVVVLEEGQNVIYVVVANAACTTMSEAVNINYQPGAEGQFYFRVTLSWNRDYADIDTHVWAPSGQHAAYYNLEINAGDLDVDDVDGYGPENFTCRTLEAGRFRVGNNNYSLHGAPATACTVRVVTGSLAANRVTRVLGPYTLSVENFNGGYPVTGNTASWWRPCDIIVGQNGSVEVVAADNQELTAGIGPAAAASAGPYVK